MTDQKIAVIAGSTGGFRSQLAVEGGALVFISRGAPVWR